MDTFALAYWSAIALAVLALVVNYVLRAAPDVPPGTGPGKSDATSRPAAGLNLTLKEVPVAQSFAVRTPVAATTVALDAEGKPGALLPAPLVYTSSDPSVLTVATSPDGLSAVVTLIAPGPATVSVASGPLAASADVLVTARPAASLVLTLAEAPAPAPTP